MVTMRRLTSFVEGNRRLLFEVSTKKNCWLRRTALESALILVLIVAAIFLVLLVIVYVYGSMFPASELCIRLCCYFGNVSTMDLAINPYAYMNRSFSNVQRAAVVRQAHKRETSRNLLSFEDGCFLDARNGNYIEYPFIGALLENLYWDSSEEGRVKCAITRISEKWSLASLECLEGGENYENFRVRTGSNYWSKGGAIYETNFIINEAFVFVYYKLSKKCRISTPVVEIARNLDDLMQSDDHHLAYYTLTWNSNLWKYRTLEKVPVYLVYSKTKCPQIDIDYYLEDFVICGVVEKNFDEDVKGPLLLAADELLVGVHLKTVYDISSNTTYLFYFKVTSLDFDLFLAVYNDE